MALRRVHIGKLSPLKGPRLVWIGLYCLLALATPSYAASTKEKLIGYWQFKRGIGGQCATQILELEYAFRRNGQYEGSAKMRNGASYKYTGTYTASDTTCTVVVDGSTVGPFPYRIDKNVLTVEQPDFGCRVELNREDY